MFTLSFHSGDATSLTSTDTYKSNVCEESNGNTYQVAVCANDGLTISTSGGFVAKNYFNNADCSGSATKTDFYQVGKFDALSHNMLYSLLNLTDTTIHYSPSYHSSMYAAMKIQLHP